MLKKISSIILIILITFIVSVGSFYYFNQMFGYKIPVNIITVTYNENPISKYHIGEFNIENSKYFEKNYERYVNYKIANPKLTDDEVITRVNIGLDNKFYTNIRESNLDDGILILCNKYNKLPKNYVPKLVTMNSKYAKGGKLHPEAYDAFKKLSDDARKLGYKIIVNSGYRSYGSQTSIYNNYVNRDGRERADTYSARPGHSEHQTGLAIDVASSGRFSSFGSTKEYTWMKANAHKYGYILRYTKKNQWITGYMNEEWHYRYVGIDAADYIYKNNITFEEYYVRFLERD